MRHQPAQITEVITGPTELFVEALSEFHPKQHDHHCRGWRWEMYRRGREAREANLREAVREIIARENARREARHNELIQIAAE